MNAYEAFILYSAVKAHFTRNNYDFFKYNGKVKYTNHSFETRKDKYFFHKLSKREDPLELLVANMSENPSLWVGDLFDNKAQEVHAVYKKRKESLTYIFKNDIDNLLDNFEDNFKVVDGQYPHLLNLLVRKKITKQSFIIINDCVRFAGKWNKQISDTIIWPKIALNCKKLQPFMQYEKDKYCRMLMEKFS